MSESKATQALEAWAERFDIAYHLRITTHPQSRQVYRLMAEAIGRCPDCGHKDEHRPDSGCTAPHHDRIRFEGGQRCPCQTGTGR